MEIHPADPDRDAAACAAIYAPHVDPGWASFEEVPPDAAELARRMRAAPAWLVAVAGGEVTGFASASRHRNRPAYRWAVEVSAYVEVPGRGTGRALYDALLPGLAARGLRVALAAIALPNPGSVALHESCGFEPVGVFRGVGFKSGAWRDVGWWQRRLD